MLSPTNIDGAVAASCHLSLHACNRLLFARWLSIESRAYVISQHACRPIRTPDWPSRLSGQRRILGTQPRGTSEHEHRLLISFRRLYFPYYVFPPHLSAFDHRAILIWGIGTWLGVVRRTNRYLQSLAGQKLIRSWNPHNEQHLRQPAGCLAVQSSGMIHCYKTEPCYFIRKLTQ